MTASFSYPGDREEANAARVRALEALLIEKGVITDTTVDKVLAYFESEMTPLNGAKIVARAWVDPDFAERVVDDTPAAIAELDLPEGMTGAEGEHIQAVANGPAVHNLVICTLCSCFPWPVLGLPPYWYKDPTFRARAAREPAGGAGRGGRGPRPVGRDQGVGLQRPLPLVRHPRAARRHRRPERGRTGRPGHHRVDDRRRPGERR